MAKTAFGEHLRREREMRGVSLEEISEATRISTRFLQALEEEHWERLPGGIFNRGFIRSIARYLGLDEDALVAEYALATDDQPELAVWATGPARPRHRLWVWTVLLLAVLGAGGWMAYRGYGDVVRAWWAEQTRTPEPAPAAPPAGTPQGGQAVPASELLELKIEAGRTTTVTVVADGVTAFDGALEAGQSRRFTARERLEVSASNSGAVLLELNGHTLPPLGPPGEPGRVVLTPKDLTPPRGGSQD